MKPVDVWPQRCAIVREGQSHSIFENPKTGRLVPNPRYREIPHLLTRAICRQLDIPLP